LAAVDSAYHNMYGNSLKKVNFLNVLLPLFHLVVIL
jgi:hypothetical protein